MDPTPDKEDPEQKPPSRGAAKESAEDRKFWGMDEEEDPPAKTKAARPSAADHDLGGFADQDDDDPLDQDLADPGNESAEPESPPRRPDEPVAAPGSRRISRRDLIWIGLLALVLLALVFWALREFMANVQPVGRPDHVDFPVKGETVVIGKINTYWRRPDPGVDRVQRDTHLIPCASIVLKSGSGSARLRCFFQNEKGDFVGDPVTLTVSDGRFTPADRAEATINATAGFAHEGEYNDYASKDAGSWHLKILEGPSSDLEDARFNEIVRLPISPKRR